MEVCSIIFYYKLSRIYNYNFDDIRWNNNISLKKLCRQLNCFSIIIIEKLFAQRIKLTKIKSICILWEINFTKIGKY